jgi:hypothetical protein
MSWWYFETDDEGNVLRQIEMFYDGPILRYSEAHPEDNLGRLAEVALDLGEFAGFEGTKEQFEQIWDFDRGVQRRAFADFLERRASGQEIPGESQELVATHYYDRKLEDIRREVARLYIEEPAGNDTPERKSQLRKFAAFLRALPPDR